MVAVPGNGVEGFKRNFQLQDVIKEMALSSSKPGVKKGHVDDVSSSSRPADGNYIIVAGHSGKVLDIQQSQIHHAGEGLQQWRWNHGLNQQFRLHHVGGEQFTIQSVQSGLYLSVANSSTAPRAPIVQLSLQPDSTSQRFRLEPQGTRDGRVVYYLTSAHSGLVIDVRGKSKSSGATVMQYPKRIGLNQLFWLSPVDAGKIKIHAGTSEAMAGAGLFGGAGAGPAVLS